MPQMKDDQNRILTDSCHEISPEALVKRLYESLSDQQRNVVCLDWNYMHPKYGLLRKFVSNNWRITEPAIDSDFFTAEQKRIIREIFEGLTNSDWHERLDRQMNDDAGGFGKAHSMAILGDPVRGDFQFVLTGRHTTVRCQGDSSEPAVFGGPIVYGHAPGGYFEKPHHPGNVFWHQAQTANRIYQMLDGRQRHMALLPKSPPEHRIRLQGRKGDFEGIPIVELSADQREHMQHLLRLLLEPYRRNDRDRVGTALDAHGGLDHCHLAFYERDALAQDGTWDNWRLEGPAFVWHYRGSPHLHVWVHVADDPSVPLYSMNRSGPLRRPPTS